MGPQYRPAQATGTLQRNDSGQRWDSGRDRAATGRTLIPAAIVAGGTVRWDLGR